MGSHALQWHRHFDGHVRRARGASPILRTGGILIVGLLIFCWAAIPQYGTPGMKQAIIATKSTLTTIKAALEEFKSTFHRYPTTAEGLKVLVEKLPLFAGWHRFLDKVPMDGWKQPFCYKCPGTTEPLGFDLYSVGADGQDGTTDDISKDDI